jgi:beta-glucosidase
MRLAFIVLLLAMRIASLAQSSSVKHVDRKADSVLKLMTLKEKIGQLNQYAKDFQTGTVTADQTNTEDKVRRGELGSFLNLRNIDDKITMQKAAMQSRLKIPLIFGFDVIHGHKTIFPIPLAQACSWDLAAIEQAERIAAIEAAADGINWTFAPMMDITYDPRWGRVMEGSGEDPYLGSLIAVARVKGFQGNDLSLDNTILACAKHFAAYGFSEAGRDYNTVDISEQRLRNVVLPPFKACADAGVGTFMNSFNLFNGVPASANEFLVRKVLKGEWQFKGFVVSDWNSFGELQNHGVAGSRKEIAQKVMTAGSDMDMEGRVYEQYLEQLVKEGKIGVKLVDDAVRRILRMKLMLGLFDDPFRYLNKATATQRMLQPAFIDHTRSLAKKSMVLLKNDNDQLPLSKTAYKKIAIVGPLANSQQDRDYMSFWTFGGDQNIVVTLADGIKSKLPNAELLVSNAGDSLQDIPQAVELAKNAEVIIAAVGEHGINNGEARSFANPVLAASQMALLQALRQLNKPMVVVLFAGRPLVDKTLFETMPVVLNAWQPGLQAGNAVADVLFGDYNPSGRLSISWPRSVGQIPLYYNHLPTGRPQQTANDFWVSRYRDESNLPQFPFGYGLSYSKFSYSGFLLSDTLMKRSGKINAMVTVKNESAVDGEETVQLYIRDVAADISRPVKELKGFQKIALKAGESKTVSFAITENDLKYWNHLNVYKADAGRFQVMVGGNSENLLEKKFEMLEK